MMIRKNYSRRTDALKTLKAYLQILSDAKNATDISHHTYQHIVGSYLLLSEYKPNTQVSKFIKEFEQIELLNREGYKTNVLIMLEELKKIDFHKITRAKSKSQDKIKEKKSKIDDYNMLNDIDQPNLNQEAPTQSFEIPQIGYAFLSERNSISLKLILQSIDLVIEYYCILYDAAKNE